MGVVEETPNYCLLPWVAVLSAWTALRVLLRLTGFHRRRGPRQRYVRPPHVGVVAGSEKSLGGQQVAQRRESDVEWRLTPCCPGGPCSRFGRSLSLLAAAAAPLLPPRREPLPPRPGRRLPCGRRVRSVRDSARCRRGYAGRRRSGCGGLSPDRASAVPPAPIGGAGSARRCIPAGRRHPTPRRRWVRSCHPPGGRQPACLTRLGPSSSSKRQYSTTSWRA